MSRSSLRLSTSGDQNPQIPKLKTLTLKNYPQFDYFSYLPDPILLEILTLLPITAAIRFSSLSKRFYHLCASIPSLVFRFDPKNHRDFDEFVSSVNCALIRSNRTDFRRICIAFDYSYDREESVSSWIHYVVDRGVEKLEILFNESVGDRFDSASCYKLPSVLFDCETLTKLEVRYCSFGNCGREIWWWCLRKLSIRLCLINDEALRTVFDGCPVLVSLELVQCHGFNRIDIVSFSLEELVIKGYLGWDDMEVRNVHVTRLNAPYLRSLVLNGHMLREGRGYERLSSLEEVQLGFGWNPLYQGDDSSLEVFRVTLVECLQRIRRVKKLTLSYFFLQIISLQDSRPLPSPLSCCKSLIVDANLEKGGLHGLASMLQSCPMLEMLTIHLLSSATVPYLPYNLMHRTKSFWKVDSSLKLFSCMQHLKTVNIAGLVPGCTETELVVEFLQFLLENAKVLEKLSINTSGYDQDSSAKNDALFGVSQALLGIPRSSPFAKIELN